MNRAYVECMQFSLLDIAKSLFKEAVILFFEKRDVLAIFYLAKQAYEILHQLNSTHQYLDNDYLTDEACSLILQYENVANTGLTLNENHALRFDPKLNEFLLLECAVMFNEGLATQFLFSKVYLIWAMAMHPQLFAETFTSKVLEGESYNIDPYDFEVMLTLLKP